MDTISYQEALALNLMFYYTGKNCPKGHQAQRYTSCQKCIECEKIKRERIKSSPAYEDTKRRARERAREYKTKDPSYGTKRTSRESLGARLRRIEGAKRWQAENADYVRELARKNRGLPDPVLPEPTTCECCGKKPGHSMHLDHCHETNEFRGWLCSNCNTGIGKLGDKIEGLEKAIEYLLRAKRLSPRSPTQEVGTGDYAQEVVN